MINSIRYWISLRSQNEMIKDIHDYVKEVTSEKYIGESRMTKLLY